MRLGGTALVVFALALGCSPPRQQPATIAVQTTGLAARLEMFAALTPADEETPNGEASAAGSDDDAEPGTSGAGGESPAASR